MKKVFLFGVVTARILAEKVSKILVDRDCKYQLDDVLFYGDSFVVFTTDDEKQAQVFVTVDVLSIATVRIKGVKEYIEDGGVMGKSITSILRAKMNLKTIFEYSSCDSYSGAVVCAPVDDFAIHYDKVVLGEELENVGSVVDVDFATGSVKNFSRGLVA